MKIKRSGPAVLAVAVALVVLTSGGLARSVHAAELIAAAARGNDIQRVQQLIDAGGDVNVPEPDGSTALLWAVYHSAPDLVRTLLEAGADPALANQLALTPLLQASRNGSAELVSALLAAGANPHGEAQSLLEPPLLAAARSGSLATVQVLLDAGADPDATEALDAQAALMWAAAEGHLDIARALLEAGADARRQARVSELTKRKNADFPTGGFAAIHWPARNGDEAMLRLLLEHGADLNVRNGDGSTPLMLAIVNDRFDLAATLLDLGAKPDDGSLYYATEMRDATHDWRAQDGTIYRADHPNTLTALELTASLLEAGADPDQPFVGQMHSASMCCDTEVDATAFYRASQAADVAGMQLMLDHGADPDWRPQVEVKDKETDTTSLKPGKSALMAAITGGKGVGVSGGPNDLRYGPPPFREEASREPLAAVELLLAAGADVDVHSSNGETALHVAAKALHPGIVRALVAAGAPIDARDDEGLTAQEAVAKMDPPKATPGFYFVAPLAQPQEIAALLQELAAAPAATDVGLAP